MAYTEPVYDHFFFARKCVIGSWKDMIFNDVLFGVRYFSFVLPDIKNFIFNFQFNNRYAWH